MIAVLEANCTMARKAEVVRFLEGEGFRVQVSETGRETLVGVIGTGASRVADALRAMPGVREVRPIAPPYPMVSREHHPTQSEVKIGRTIVGGNDVVIMAGPCAVESRAQLLAAARAVAAAGATILRGGAFKPRTSPYSFQGLGEEGLALLAEARAETGLPVVTEVLAPEDVPLVAKYADVLQIGARNVQNFRLLAAAGSQSKPVLLKRGMMSTFDELCGAAEYIVSAGNPQVILCERGIRTFEPSTRNTLDVSAIPVLRERTHLPLIADPSHAAGRRDWVAALAKASIACGADGLIIEVHPDPATALSDGPQSLNPAQFATLMGELRKVAEAVGRRIAPPVAKPAPARSA